MHWGCSFTYGQKIDDASEESITDDGNEDSSNAPGRFTEGSDNFKPRAYGSTASDFGTKDTNEGFTEGSDGFKPKSANSDAANSETGENETDGYTEGSDIVRKSTDTSKTKSITTESENDMTDGGNNEENKTSPDLCSEDEEWWDCKPTLHNTCENFARAEARKDFKCEPGCFCKYGLILTDGGECVEPFDCPDPVCEGHESVTDCMNPCNTCEANCAPCNFLDCIPGCDCMDGFKRNTNGTCIHASKCPACTTSTMSTTLADTTTTTTVPENFATTSSFPPFYSTQVTATADSSIAAPIDTTTTQAVTGTT